jgi:transcriptional regulator with GAF, ATPase, and Fis domain
LYQDSFSLLSLKPFREAINQDSMDLPIQPGTGSIDFPERLPTIKDITESLIEEALLRAKNNQAIAAGLLGITPQALSKRLSRKNKNGMV